MIDADLGQIDRPSPDALFEATYDRHRAVLVAWLRRLTRDEAVAEDICQEAFVRLLRELRAGHPPEHELAWLHTVARNLVISRARRAQVVARRTPRPRRAFGAEDPTGEQAADRECLVALLAALDAMDPARREVLQLALGGLGARQVAARLGISEGAARTRLHRVRRTLLGAADRLPARTSAAPPHPPV